MAGVCGYVTGSCFTRRRVAVKIDELKFYTDGGSRGNPGPAASGVVILGMDDKVINEFGVYLGTVTNNVAEWTAVKLALEAIEKYGPRTVHAYMDSELVCRQLTGQYRVKHPDLQPLYRQVLALAARYEITFEHVYRAKNKLADAQVNLAIDRALGLKR
jgi:ribonuclease HI